MTLPRVSIHIITYNQQQFIEETLRSAVEQDYDNLQVVVGDDASTDGTPDVIRDFERRYPGRVVSVFAERNSGITANANRVLALCDGDLIALQGGDDVFLPGKIAKQVEWMRERPSYAISYHDVELFDSATGAPQYLMSDRHLMLDGDASVMVREGTFFAATAAMVRRSAMPAHGFDPSITAASDWLFFIECLAGGGRVGPMPEVLARYRRHPHNATLDRVRGRREEWQTLDLVASRFPDLASDVRMRKADLAFLDASRALRQKRVGAAAADLARSVALSRGMWRSPRLLLREAKFYWKTRGR